MNDEKFDYKIVNATVPALYTEAELAERQKRAKEERQKDEEGEWRQRMVDGKKTFHNVSTLSSRARQRPHNRHLDYQGPLNGERL